MLKHVPLSEVEPTAVSGCNACKELHQDIRLCLVEITQKLDSFFRKMEALMDDKANNQSSPDIPLKGNEKNHEVQLEEITVKKDIEINSDHEAKLVVSETGKLEITFLFHKCF